MLTNEGYRNEVNRLTEEMYEKINSSLSSGGAIVGQKGFEDAVRQKIRDARSYLDFYCDKIMNVPIN